MWFMTKTEQYIKMLILLPFISLVLLVGHSACRNRAPLPMDFPFKGLAKPGVT